MEFKEFVHIIKSNLVYFVALIIIGAFAGLSSSRFFSSGFQHAQVYLLQEPPIEFQSSEIRSEYFFQQEKARNFTDSAIAILMSPNFQNDVVFPSDSLQVRKLAPQVIRITYISPKSDSSFANLERVVSHYNSKITDLTENPKSSKLKPISQNGEPVYSAMSKTTLILAGAILGLLFAFLIIGSKNYFKI